MRSGSLVGIVLGTALLVGAADAGAQSLGGTLGATLTLTSACTISGDNEVSDVDFGTLDFGSRPSTFLGTLAAQPTGGAGISGQTRIVCSPDLDAITVTVDSGLHDGEGAGIGVGSRALANGSTNFVPYEVYADTGHTTAYPTNGSGLSVNVPVAGAPFDIPLYGRINKTSPTALAAGVYSDTLVVTITF
jgi:spore coat protein U-like protein